MCWVANLSKERKKKEERISMGSPTIADLIQIFPATAPPKSYDSRSFGFQHHTAVLYVGKAWGSNRHALAIKAGCFCLFTCVVHAFCTKNKQVERIEDSCMRPVQHRHQ